MIVDKPVQIENEIVVLRRGPNQKSGNRYHVVLTT
jgi:hypothetical protein